MMFKSLCTYGAVLAFSAIQVSAHAAISPALGVSGTAARSDVQRPSDNNPCGRMNVASAIDSSTAVTADASGSFTVEIENFNGGRDGSRQVSMQVDASGTGDNFVDGTVSANGEAAPRGTGTEQITASLPAGTTCSGGASGDLCVVSFTTLGGFGNCVAVQQAGGGGGAAAGGNNNGNADGNNGNGNNANDNADDNADGNGNNGNGNANGNGNNGNGNNGNGNANGNNANDNANGNGNNADNNANGNGNNASGNGNGNGNGGPNRNGANGNGNSNGNNKVRSRIERKSMRVARGSRV